ncbi:MAG: glucose dehydrogenase [Gammaproteobacteria bacterium]|jgi:glucose dehydrogenase
MTTRYINNKNRFANYCLILFLIAASDQLASQVGPVNGEWPVYGGDSGSTRYSPLDQINASNVTELEIAWRWSAGNFGPTPESNYRNTPIMVDGVLYATAGSRRAIVAIDAMTGETLWVYRLDEGVRGASSPRVNSGRGVAYWKDAKNKARIYYITSGYRLIALDAATGRPIPGFADNGALDLMDSLRVPDGVNPIGTIGSSSPPIIVNNVVIVGSAHLSGRIQYTPENIPGDIRGFDARTGKLLWSFHVVPADGEPGAETWENNSNRYSGNGGVWTTFSADLERGIVYLPTEASTHDWYGGHRLGDNLYTSSLVALNAQTGKRIWHFQIVHHDVWDLDNPAAPILVDIEVEGKSIPAVAQITKQGWVFVFNRETGEPVWPINELPVPTDTNVPGERLSPTQPVPSRPPAFTRQGLTEDDLIDFTPELREQALSVLEGTRFGSIYTPIEISNIDNGPRGTVTLPRSTGGGNWEGGSVDPQTGVLYITSQMSATVEGLMPPTEGVTVDYMLIPQETLLVDGLPAVKPPYGQISAIDLNRGEMLWQIANADTPDEIADHPALAGLELGRTGRANRVGLLATRTLLFAGEGVGGRPVFRAHDKATGKILAEIDLPATQTGMPMTYMVDGIQYIVIAVASKGHPAELVALRLP